MPDTTPGATAYGAYQRRLHNLTEHIPLDYPRPFSTLSAVHQAAWEAAAQAVQDRVMQDLIAGGASAREERQARQPEDTS